MAESENGAPQFKQIPIEKFELSAKEKAFDIAVEVDTSLQQELIKGNI